MQLDKVYEAFTKWRANKNNGSECIPEYLWEMVEKLQLNYKRSTICKTLGLSTAQFKKYCLGTLKSSIAQDDGFVEAVLPTSTPHCEISLQGKRNTLSIKILPQQLSMILPLLETYL